MKDYFPVYLLICLDSNISESYGLFHACSCWCGNDIVIRKLIKGFGRLVAGNCRTIDNSQSDIILLLESLLN